DTVHIRHGLGELGLVAAFGVREAGLAHGSMPHNDAAVSPPDEDEIADLAVDNADESVWIQHAHEARTPFLWLMERHIVCREIVASFIAGPSPLPSPRGRGNRCGRFRVEARSRCIGR